MSPAERFAGIRAAAARRPHGTHARYVAGCHCFECRVAHTRYNTARERAKEAGGWNGMVPASRSIAHLDQLATVGVGGKAVAAAAGISYSVIGAIRWRGRTNVRAETERRILAVTAECALDGALVSSRAAWKLLDELIGRGYSRAQLARWLGFKNQALQFKRGRPMKALTVSRIERMYRMVEAGRLRRDR